MEIDQRPENGQVTLSPCQQYIRHPDGYRMPMAEFIIWTNTPVDKRDNHYKIETDDKHQRTIPKSL
jgi:hypothetical protein